MAARPDGASGRTGMRQARRPCPGTGCGRRAAIATRPDARFSRFLRRIPSLGSAYVLLDDLVMIKRSLIYCTVGTLLFASHAASAYSECPLSEIGRECSPTGTGTCVAATCIEYSYVDGGDLDLTSTVTDCGYCALLPDDYCSPDGGTCANGAVCQSVPDALGVEDPSGPGPGVCCPGLEIRFTLGSCGSAGDGGEAKEGDASQGRDAGQGRDASGEVTPEEPSPSTSGGGCTMSRGTEASGLGAGASLAVSAAVLGLRRRRRAPGRHRGV